jgi:hypothetical protein
MGCTIPLDMLQRGKNRQVIVMADQLNAVETGSISSADQPDLALAAFDNYPGILFLYFAPHLEHCQRYI